MNVGTFMITGISSANHERVSQELALLDGSKPLVANNQTGLHVFVCISTASAEVMAASVASAITGTGASIFQANFS